MLEAPEEAPRPTGERAAHYHQYPEAIDLTGKDLLSCFGRRKSDVAALVGAMLDKSQMSTMQLPVESLMNMTREIADELHEWPSAIVAGPEFRHLVLQFLDDRLIGFRFTFHDPPRTASAQKNPWWRFW